MHIIISSQSPHSQGHHYNITRQPPSRHATSDIRRTVSMCVPERVTPARCQLMLGPAGTEDQEQRE